MLNNKYNDIKNNRKNNLKKNLKKNLKNKLRNKTTYDIYNTCTIFHSFTTKKLSSMQNFFPYGPSLPLQPICPMRFGVAPQPMGRSKKLLKVYENPQKKNEGKLSTTNGCRCLAAAAVCNNSNSRPCTRRDEAWPRGARTLLQPLIFVCLGQKQRKKRIQKFYCYTRKITTARERVRGEGERGDDDDGCRASHFGYVSVSVDVEAKSKSRHIEGDYPAKSKA